MRFVEGRTVQEALRAGPFEPARALRIAAQVARSLEEAELRGIVHRDIKPDNIMLAEPGGGAQVMDFGIARQAGSSALTSTGSFIGTPLYAAPEAASELANARSDIYSLGATPYHMLTGGPPFSGEALDVLRQHRDAPPPAEPLAALPVEISDAVLRCLAKDPAERHQSASELAGVLEQLAERAATRGDEPLPTEAITVAAAQRADTGAITISLGEVEMSPSFLPGARKNSFELALRNAAPPPGRPTPGGRGGNRRRHHRDRAAGAGHDPLERQHTGHRSDQPAPPPLAWRHAAAALQRLRGGRRRSRAAGRRQRRIRGSAGALAAVRGRRLLLGRRRGSRADRAAR
jgi:hypothetical protein